MTRSFSPRPLRAKQEDEASVAARVLGLPDCSYSALQEQWQAV
jgi:hypothetical protein